MSGVDDLVRWLGEQLDTDAARALQWHDLECGIHAHLNADLLAIVATSRMLQDVPGAVCDCGGPARVLAEIAAKRDLLAFAKGIHDHHATFTTGVYARLEQVLRLYALAYKDRPGYAEAIASVK